MRRGREIVASRAEEDVYKALGLPYIEPELREGRDEIALAKAGRLSRLVRSADVNGILHAHTNASDGVNTLEEMAEAARSRGYEYIGITDHSKSAHYAGGLPTLQGLANDGIGHAAEEALVGAEGELVNPVRLEAVATHSHPALAGVSLEVHAGEIVGVAGIEGSGQVALLQTLAGCPGLRPKTVG